MKKFTNKERAEIYLKTAICIENAKNKVVGCCYYLKRVIRHDGDYDSMKDLIPEFMLFRPKRVGEIHWWKRDAKGYEERVLALLFSREIALNP